MGYKFSDFVLLLIAAVAVLSSTTVRADSSKISQIAMSNEGIPFLLDSNGSVWGFKRPFTLEDPIKLAIPSRIKTIKPFIALTADGHVFTWAIASKQSLSKDSSGDGNGDGSIVVTYAQPELHNNIPIVSDISYATGRLGSGDFYALGTDNSIYEWTHDPVASPQLNMKIEYNPPLADITSFSSSGFTTAYLFGKTRLLGWGMNSEGQLGANTHGVGVRPIVLPDWPEQVQLPEEAHKVVVGTFHTFVLADSGKVFVWGGCHPSGANLAGDKPDMIAGVQYELANVQDVAVSIDDNLYPDTFLKTDGTVWIGYAPANKGVHDLHCGRTYENGSLTYHAGMPVRAVAIAMGGDQRYPILALGEDGTLWGISYRNTSPRNWGQSDPAHSYESMQKLSVDLDNPAEVQK
jgi:alpha-tubulin suppressor-like RCC1 family protein